MSEANDSSFMASVQVEGQEPTIENQDDVEKETPAVPPAEDKTDETDAPSQEGDGDEPDNTPAEENVPFHKPQTAFVVSHKQNLFLRP